MLNGRKLSRQGGPFSSFSLSELLLIHCLVNIDPYRRIRRWTWRSLQSSSSEVNHMLPKWSLFPERWMLWTCCPTTMTTSWLAWMFPRAYTACPFLRPTKILSHVLRVGPNHFFDVQRNTVFQSHILRCSLPWALLITSFSCLGPMANSWCYPRTRRSPAFWLGGSCSYWWGCLSIEWLALIRLLSKCLNRTISIKRSGVKMHMGLHTAPWVKAKYPGIALYWRQRHEPTTCARCPLCRHELCWSTKICGEVQLVDPKRCCKFTAGKTLFGWLADRESSIRFTSWDACIKLILGHIVHMGSIIHWWVGILSNHM